MPQRRVTRFGAVVLVALALTVSAVEPLSASGGGAPRFSLPWTDGTVWRMTGGPHSNTGRGRPWSSIDFAGPIAGKSYPVRAAASGYVTRPCPNLIEIRHGDGWQTTYYHVANIRVRQGQFVKRGAVLGWTSTRAGCGGFATGPHVHFSIKHNGRYVDLGGFVLGGWTVRDGRSQYLGCLVRDDAKRCAPNARLYNFGA